MVVRRAENTRCVIRITTLVLGVRLPLCPPFQNNPLGDCFVLLILTLLIFNNIIILRVVILVHFKTVYYEHWNPQRGSFVLKFILTNPPLLATLRPLFMWDF